MDGYKYYSSIYKYIQGIIIVYLLLDIYTQVKYKFALIQLVYTSFLGWFCVVLFDLKAYYTI